MPGQDVRWRFPEGFASGEERGSLLEEVRVCVLPGLRALKEVDPDEPDGRRVGVIHEEQAGRSSPGRRIQVVDIDDGGRAARELDQTRVRGNHGKVTVDELSGVERRGSVLAAVRNDLDPPATAPSANGPTCRTIEWVDESPDARLRCSAFPAVGS
jgi:hypothetical protein